MTTAAKRRGPKPRPLLHRFLAMVKKTRKCWIWRGAVKKNGYGVTSVRRKTMYAHRASLQLFGGGIPRGLVVDHLCRNRRCVNPKHLEAVTIRENLLRGNGWSGRAARKTHCIRGHILQGENLYEFALKAGRRKCKICTRKYVNERARAERRTT